MPAPQPNGDGDGDDNDQHAKSTCNSYLFKSNSRFLFPLTFFLINLAFIYIYLCNFITQITIEEVMLDMERSNGKTQHAKISIRQRQLDQSYQGELYYDRDFRIQGTQKLGATCR